MKQQVKIYKVKGNPKNPRVIKNDKFKSLKNSIKTLPNYMKLRPIILNEDMMVLGGNMRLKASIDLGKKEIWTDMFTQADCDEMNKIAIEEKRETKTYLEYCDEIIIKDNVSAGDWEWDMLANEWDSVQLNDFGLDVWENEDDKVTEGLIEDDEIPEVKESKVKRGDIWQLGEHRVMCGDSTSSDDVEKLMNGEKADLVFTDPPYGMNLDTDYSKMKNNSTFAKEKGVKDGKKYNKVIGDNQDFKMELITTIFKNFDYCKEIFIWGIDYFAEHIEDKNKGSWFVWDKRVDENFDKMYGSCFELCYSKNKHKREIIRVRWASVFGTEKEFDHKRHHPTQKPILLSENFVKKYSKENNTIIDLYLGSGSTLIAAEKLNRKCYGMELDEKYCDVIINRWEQFTGLKATIINGTK